MGVVLTDKYDVVAGRDKYMKTKYRPIWILLARGGAAG